MISIISSTNRPESYSLRLSKWINNCLTDSTIPSQILDLAELPGDFPAKKIRKINYPEFDSEIISKIENVNKFIFVIPEYNGSFPGILKTLIDSVPPRYFHGKKASLIGISSGKFGALRALDDFTGVLHYLQVEVLSNKPKLPEIEKLIDQNGKISDINTIERLQTHLNKIYSF